MPEIYLWVLKNMVKDDKIILHNLSFSRLEGVKEQNS